MTATELMEKITNLPTRSSMFRLAVSTADYDPGYTAYVDFRGDDNSVHASGSTAEEALQALFDKVEAECVDPDYYKNRVVELEEQIKLLANSYVNIIISSEIPIPSDMRSDLINLIGATAKAKRKGAE